MPFENPAIILNAASSSNRFVKYLILQLLLLPFWGSAQSPSQKPDSLYLALHAAADDTVRMDVYGQLVDYYTETNWDSAYVYNEKLIALAVQLKLTLVEASALDKKGYILMYLGNYPESLQAYLKALQIAENKAHEINIWGLKNRKTPKIVRLSILENIYHDLGHLYGETGNIDKQIESYLETKKIATSIQDAAMLAFVNMNLGDAYFNHFHQLDTALQLELSALAFFSKSDYRKYEGNVLNIIGNIYFEKKAYNLSRDYYFSGAKINLEQNNLERLVASYLSLSHLYRTTLQLDSSLIFAHKTLEMSRALRDPNGMAGAYRSLSDTYGQLKQQDSAFAYLKLATALADSLHIVEKNKLSEFHNVGFNEQLRLAELEKEKIQLQSDMRTYGLLSGIFIFLVIAAILFMNNKQKQKANKELTIAKERAEQSEQFEQQFLANMSHEIRTPMNAVMGMTNLLIDNNPRSDQQYYLHGIKNSSDTLLHIINDILDLSKIEAGKIELEQIDFSVREVLGQVRQTLMHKAEEKGLELITDIDSRTPEVIIGDPTRLNQVLMNLAGNAIKFTEKGSVTIEIKPGAGDNDLLFSVIDTGIGIPKDKMQSVFDSFTQANASDTRKFGGTGLGLSISKQLVELMGGHISVASEEGAGTVFSFEINCSPGSRERLNEQRSSGKIDGSILDGLRILIVDDNEYNRIVVRDTLKSRADIVLLEATNGKESLDTFESHEIDVVLMDVQMPVMNGYEATQRIREQFASPKNDTPVIALTASVIRSDLDKCREAGMNDYVPKPFKTAQLITAIAKATGREIRFVEEAHAAVAAKTIPGASVTNLAYLTNFCEGDAPRMQKYIRMFLDSAPALIEKVNTCLLKQDYEEIANQVHSFKTKWIMMGMSESKDLALLIEKHCREGKNDSEVKENILILLGQIEKAIEELNRNSYF